MTKEFMKGVVSVLSVAILAGGVCAAGYCSRGNSGKWFENITKPNEWSWKDKPQSGDNNDTPPEEHNTFDGLELSNSIDSNGVSLFSAVIAREEYAAYGITPYADTAYTLTATVLPAEATNKAVDYTVDWKNPTSAWASGKNVTEYVNVAQTSDGSLTATATCFKPFEEPIVITCTSRDNPSAQSYVNSNYIKRLINTTLALGNGVVLNGDNSSVYTWYADSDKILNDYNDIYSIGTKEDNVVNHYVSITTSTALRTQLAKVWTSTRDRNTYTATRTYKVPYGKRGDFTWNALFVPQDGAGSGWSEIEGLFSFCSDTIDYGEWEINKTQFNKLITCLKASDVDFIMTVKSELASGAEYSKTYNVNVADSVLKIGVTSVGTNVGEIDF